MPPTPITIVTGFLGSGKTSLILNLIPQLPETYKIALLKNEFGDLNIDSQLASSAAISGVQELLNGCICCNLVGQLSDALETLRRDVSPDRIIIETSGSAFPATLAMEVNRMGRETGDFSLDGVVVVIDVENWQGYEDTSYTAKMQARYTDLIVFNKWELVDERRYDDCLDRVGDLEVEVAKVKSDRGKVDKDLLMGLDSALAKVDASVSKSDEDTHHDHADNHQSEVEVLSVTLSSANSLDLAIDLDKLESLLKSAPKDEIYRIKAIVACNRMPKASEEMPGIGQSEKASAPSRYILNWAFGRWNFTRLIDQDQNGTSSDSKFANRSVSSNSEILRMTVILARDESAKWSKKLEGESLITPNGPSENTTLHIRRLV